MRYDMNQGDTTPPLRTNLSDENGPVPFEDATITFRMEQVGVADPKIVIGPVVPLDPEDEGVVEGDVEYEWRPDGSDTDTPGVFHGQWRVVFLEGTPQQTQETFPSGDNDEENYDTIVIKRVVAPGP